MVWTYVDYVMSTKSISTKFWSNINNSVSPKFWTKSKLIAEIPHGTFFKWFRFEPKTNTRPTFKFPKIGIQNTTHKFGLRGTQPYDTTKKTLFNIDLRV